MSKSLESRVTAIGNNWPDPPYVESFCECGHGIEIRHASDPGAYDPATVCGVCGRPRIVIVGVKAIDGRPVHSA